MATLLHQGVFGEMSRMTFRRIPTPIEDEVGAILHFAERASDLSAQLGGNFCGTVSQRCVTIKQAAE